MTAAHVLLGATLGVPLVLLAACAWTRVRERMLTLLAVAPVPALLAALFFEQDAVLTIGPAHGFYRATLALDAPGALLLGVAALLWIAAGAYAATYQRDAANAGRFAAGWLLALTGCLGVFIAADMAMLYLMLAMMTFGASALVFHDESPGARRAAAIYLGLALAGETMVLVAMIQLAALTPDGSLLLRDAAAVLPSAPQRDVIITLLVIGFGLKAGLVPLHVWMPLAHSAAPMPASAVLSGVVVKAGIIGLIRFLPVDTALADWGNLLAIVGMVTALYAVVIGITQAHPKVVLAYSSVSQMGFTVAVIGMGIANADAAAPVLAAFYATHHILVKGAMFLLVGVVAATCRDASPRHADTGHCPCRRTRRTAIHRRCRGQARGQGTPGRWLGRDGRVCVGRRHDLADAALPAPGDGELRRRPCGSCRAGTALAVGCHGDCVDPGSVGALSRSAARHRVRPHRPEGAVGIAMARARRRRARVGAGALGSAFAAHPGRRHRGRYRWRRTPRNACGCRTAAHGHRPAAVGRCRRVDAGDCSLVRRCLVLSDVVLNRTGQESGRFLDHRGSTDRPQAVVSIRRNRSGSASLQT